MSTVDLERPAEVAPGRGRLPRPRLAPAAGSWGAWEWVAALLVAIGVVLRFVAPTPMWLDEAQTVAIAELPLGELLDALRKDGSPPLSYLLFHAWIGLFGTGTAAVRLLPSLLGLLALPLGWAAARSVGSRTVAWSTLVLLATSPFAVRYATEARMYSLVEVLVLAGIVLVVRAFDQATPLRLAGVAAVTGALVLTHYWALFLILVVGAGLAVTAVSRREGRPSAFRLLVAMAAGCALFVPWVPSFVVQLRRTGAPWGRPPGAGIVEAALGGFAGGPGQPATLLRLVLVAITGLAAALPFTAAARGSRGRAAAVLAALSIATLAVAAVALEASDDAFAARHAMVVFPLVVLAVACAAAELRRRPRRLAIGVAGALGLIVAITSLSDDRTQALEIAAAVSAAAAPGDIVVTCPDQLAPALVRAGVQPDVLVPEGPASPLDWTDYRSRLAAVDPEALALALHERAGAGTIWLVWSPEYVRVGRVCSRLRTALDEVRPGGSHVVRRQKDLLEDAGVWRAPPLAPGAARE